MRRGVGSPHENGEEINAPRPADSVNRPHAVVRRSVGVGTSLKEGLDNLHIVRLRPCRTVSQIILWGVGGGGRHVHHTG